MSDINALFTPAVKAKLKARLAIDGPTGSGKTWTALQAARILAGPDGRIGLIDTEQGSAAYYAPTPGVEIHRVNFYDQPYEFDHMIWSEKYDPVKLGSIIRQAAPLFDVLVVDSLTHFWTGEGGTLDIVDNTAARGDGNRFTAWNVGTPAQRGMVDSILNAPCHVIVTMRSKMDYVMGEKTDRDGRVRKSVDKVGMAPEQRAGIEYEFTVVADMDLEHKAIVGKSRCDRIADAVAPRGESFKLWETFRDWLDSGVTLLSDSQLAEIKRRCDSITTESDRRDVKIALVEQFGPVKQITNDRWPTIVAWLDTNIGREQPGSDVSGDVPADPPLPPAETATQPENADKPVAAPVDPPTEPTLEPDEADPDPDEPTGSADAPMSGELAWATGVVAELSLHDVIAELQTRGKSANGRQSVLRERLAKLLASETPTTA